jgi:hypothetical protein
MAAPILFRSSDAGALTLSGTDGELITNVLDPCLTCRNVFTSTNNAGSTGVVDNTAKARSQATAVNAGTWLLFQTPATTDAAFVGLTQKFGRLTLKFGTAGVQATAVTLAVEYWNGAWTAVSGLADGTSGLTADGTLTWTVPSDWATVALNGITCYWVRLRFTAGTWTTNPLVQYATVLGWTQVYGPSSNTVVYQQPAGNMIFLNVQDNGASNTGGGSPTARDARPQGFETMSAINTGTNPWPVSVNATAAWRKSDTADGTVRAWVLWADDRTIYLFPAYSSSNYVGLAFGEFYSLVVNDNYRNMIIGDDAETAGTLNANNGQMPHAVVNTTCAGHYLDRGYHGAGAAAAFGKNSDSGFLNQATNFIGVMTYPNSADGRVFVAPIRVIETGTYRGRLRGLWAVLHPLAGFTDGDPLTGTGDYAGKSFVYIKTVFGSSNCAFAFEVSDTVETN